MTRKPRRAIGTPRYPTLVEARATAFIWLSALGAAATFASCSDAHPTSSQAESRLSTQGAVETAAGPGDPADAGRQSQRVERETTDGVHALPLRDDAEYAFRHDAPRRTEASVERSRLPGPSQPIGGLRGRSASRRRDSGQGSA